MSVTTDILPLSDTIEPPDQASLAEAVREASASRTAVYPLGGRTSLEYGLPARQPGLGLSLVRLSRVIDYPARDMTITVEAGITMQQLADTLASENQWLPVDAPQPAEATLGGVLATGFNGPRRYGWAVIRDYVIGISAVDGRGTPFKGGGRVVKNVAGYDFCKLLTGSLGTLGIITQVTLKIRPLPEQSAIVGCDVASLDQAEQLLAALVNTAVRPAAIEFLAGPAWTDDAALGPLAQGGACRLAVGLEAAPAEVDWMVDALRQEWQAQGISQTHVARDQQAAELWSRLREFPTNTESPLTIKASVRPGQVTAFVRLVLEIDPNASIQAHAGNGIVIARFANFQPASVSRDLIGRLQPAAKRSGGHVVVLTSNVGDLTRQAVWGGADEAVAWMSKVKRQFDPHNILNPGRFIYEH